MTVVLVHAVLAALAAAVATPIAIWSLRHPEHRRTGITYPDRELTNELFNHRRP